MSLSLSEQLSQITLKKTETSRKNLDKPEKLICENSKEYDRLTEEAYFERYYDAIAEFTFKSSMFELTQTEIHALLASSRRKDDDDNEDDDNDVQPQSLKAEMESALEDLKTKIDHRFEKMGIGRDRLPGFVRLSTRSPKDASLKKPGFATAYRKCLKEKREQNRVFQQQHPDLPPSSDDNSKLQAVHAASILELAVRSGAEAVELLLLSKRIRGDLKKHVKASSPPPLHIILRQFAEIEPENEFRVFVHRRRVTAATQYNAAIYVPTLVENKRRIRERIREFVEGKIIPALSLDSYVLDVVVVGVDELFVVEVNPFAEFADAVLFSWSQDRDSLTSDSKFEFRVVEGNPKFARENVNEEFMRVVKEEEEEEEGQGDKEEEGEEGEREKE